MRVQPRAAVLATVFASITACSLMSLDGFTSGTGPVVDPGQTDAPSDSLMAATTDSGADSAVPALPVISDAAGPDALAIRDGSTKVVFATSVTFTGNLGGLAGADAKCQALADAAKLPGLFRAWLSDGAHPVANRFTHPEVSYVLPTGAVVADNWTALTSGTLLNAINQTESGGFPPVSTGPTPCGGKLVWTNTAPNGDVSGTNDCWDWTSESDAGEGAAGLGVSGSTSSQWTHWCTGSTPCSNRALLYCFEQ